MCGVPVCVQSRQLMCMICAPRISEPDLGQLLVCKGQRKRQEILLAQLRFGSMTLRHRLKAQLLAQSKKSIRWMIQRILFLQGFSQQHQKKKKEQNIHRSKNCQNR